MIKVPFNLKEVALPKQAARLGRWAIPAFTLEAEPVHQLQLMNTFYSLGLITFLLASSRVLGGPAEPTWPGTFSTDPSGRFITMADGASNLVLRLNLEHGCKLDRVRVRGREVLSPNSGVYTGIAVSNQWFTTLTLPASPKLLISSHGVTINDIRYGGDGIGVKETWHFALKGGQIEWQIKRHYLTGGCLDDSGLPAWEFADMNTWTGGLLDNGGVAWNRYLDSPNATLGMHAGGVIFWNKDSADALRIQVHSEKAETALRFSHQPARTELAVFSITDDELVPKHNLRRFLNDRQDVWGAFTISPSETTVTYTLQALDYAQTYDRGQFVGLDGDNIREALNTIGRYGVIDRHIVGANGWRTGFACLHEQWFSQIGIAVANDDYIANCAATYDFERDHAVGPHGRVKSRWSFDAGDAMPGSYDAFGFYEAQWGYLMDSQPAFAICIAEQFDLTGDKAWLRRHKANCERVLDYLLGRDVNQNGLLEMMTDSHADHRGSDWIDIIWAAHENALVNAEMYYALTRWASLESLLGDSSRAETFRSAASHLKATFNKTIGEGGFWDPEKICYAYWRDKDGSIHGTNLVIPVNFAAIGYGVCDDPARRGAILQNIETQMQRENLFFWPLSFFPYHQSEGHSNNFPYPRYENGDIFLSWGELGVRAYAQTEPAVALKYIRNVLAKYNRDGLSFQRYLRRSQEGAGDDILAGNCMTIVGLYRDIYGVQPRNNRLYLEPHLTTELNGTKLKYPLRGNTYTIDLSTGSYEVGSGRFALKSSDRFGINIAADHLQFFPRQAEQSELSLRSHGDGVARVRIDAWPEDETQPRQWTQLTTGSPCAIAETVSRLQPARQYELRINDKSWRKLRADDSGAIQFNLSLGSNVARLELLAVP